MEKSVSFAISVSVLTAAYNAAAVLEWAVQSVQAQTLGDWEMIIVDDHSSDGTAALAENLVLHDPRLRVIRHAQGQGAGLCYTGFLRVSDRGERHVRVPKRVTRAQLLLGNCICCFSAIYDRALLGSVFMPSLPLRQDYALWLALLEVLPCAVGIEAPLVRLHVTRGSLSSNNWRAMRATWAIHHRHLGTGALRSGGYVLSHTLRRVLRG